MGRREEMVEKVTTLMDQQEQIRNIGIIAHIDHGKTTLTDNFVSGAGLLSEDLSGKACVMDFHADEQERGITINTANISLVYKKENKDYLVNIIDTPGHVDFSGEVTRAMRAVDGAIVVVCAVEGAMPQTETVLRQALRERVRPVLFINKVDRLINELQVTPEDMQKRFAKIIGKFNDTVQKMAPPEFKESWQVKPEDGTVAFGSAYHNWGITVPYMKKTGMSFKDIFDHCKEEKQKELSKRLVLYDAIIEMVIAHLPNPVKAQQYRIPVIWHGDQASETGKAMVSCNREGPLSLMVTNICIDPHAGPVSTCRVFSGTVRKGLKLRLSNASVENTVQSVGLYMGAERLNVERVYSGNIVALTGLRDAYAGETVSEQGVDPFEAMKHFSEPVITKSIEAKNTSDLPKLVEILRQVAKEDPMIRVEINEETGEHLISGMGELHLEIIENRIKTERHLEVETSPPIIVYRETVTMTSPQVEGKSPNRHNRFYFTVEPLPEAVFKALAEGEITEKDMKQPKELQQKLVDLGMDREETKKVWGIHNKNLLLDNTKGVQYLNETKELIVQGFKEAIDKGPLANEKVLKVLVRLHDAKLHEDAVHRGPSQVLPAIRKPIYAAMLSAAPTLMEPYQKVFITVPQDLMGSVTRNIQGRRGRIGTMEQDDENIIVEGLTPLAEMFGFAGDIRSATGGKAIWSTEYAGYERMPSELQPRIVKQIRERKGLKAEVPQPKDFMEP
ncbi:MAG: elongation factor EF-2 [Candidatus Diapherotrites archaeon]|nr:elongation factor EF-2 [Candidatus Diapherotrites archaeon]